MIPWYVNRNPNLNPNKLIGTLIGYQAINASYNLFSTIFCKASNVFFGPSIDPDQSPNKSIQILIRIETHQLESQYEHEQSMSRTITTVHEANKYKVFFGGK